MLWTEKYRPVKLSQIVGQPAFVMDAEKWVENPDDMMNVLLYGVAGVGKTAAAIALANEVLGDYKDGNFFEVDMSNFDTGQDYRIILKLNYLGQEKILDSSLFIFSVT